MAATKSTVKVPIGMRRSWFFPIATEPDSAKPTYSEKLDMGAAVKGYLTVTTASASIPIVSSRRAPPQGRGKRCDQILLLFQHADEPAHSGPT